MFALLFRIIKLTFIGLVIATALAVADDPADERCMEEVIPAEPWVIQRHKALREGTIPPPRDQPASPSGTAGPTPRR